MPPSLYLRTLPTIFSVKNGQRFILAPRTLALSPGRVTVCSLLPLREKGWG